jgi:peptidoglycan/LPS O-acetylase OafA/YrhL
MGVALQDVLLAGGVALLLPALLRDPGPATTTSRVGLAAVIDLGARFGRDASYPFYLWHLAVVLIAFQLGLRGWPAFAVVLVGATAIGLVSHRMVEAPGMRLGARWAERLALRGTHGAAASVPVVTTPHQPPLVQDVG